MNGRARVAVQEGADGVDAGGDADRGQHGEEGIPGVDGDDGAHGLDAAKAPVVNGPGALDDPLGEEGGEKRRVEEAECEECPTMAEQAVAECDAEEDEEG